jgi:hypothetical protein
VTEQSQNKEFPQPEFELRESPDSYEISLIMPPGIQIDQPVYAVENQVLLMQYQIQEKTSQAQEKYQLEVELPGPVDATKSNGEWAATWLRIELPKIKFELPSRLKPKWALRNSSLGKPPTSKYPMATGKANSNLSRLAGESGIDDVPGPIKR